MKQIGIEDTLELTVGTPEPVRSLPTFDRARRRRLSPMIRARFEYAGAIDIGLDTWLSPTQLERWVRKREVRSYHKALREHWAGSAPSLFPDRDLSLFIVTDGIRDNLTYLVWRDAKTEPEIWTYRGMETYEFKDLAAYLEWLLNRE